ncbi:helix-hairpin-helix domain-containing protein [Nitratifractor sp.]
MAEKIVAFREENGPIEKLEDLLKIKGLGKKKLEKIKEHIAIK